MLDKMWNFLSTLVGQTPYFNMIFKYYQIRHSLAIEIQKNIKSFGCESFLRPLSILSEFGPELIDVYAY